MSAISQSSRPEINESNSRHMTADMEDLELMQATGCRQMQSRSAVDCLYGCRVNQSQAKPSRAVQTEPKAQRMPRLLPAIGLGSTCQELDPTQCYTVPIALSYNPGLDEPGAATEMGKLREHA
jgi:hypothetical protein